MSWIALKMLVGDRAKFLGIVMGLTFSALLIMQQGSIFCGLMRRTAGQIIDITGADLWVMDPNVRFVDDVKPMIENNLYRVRGVDGVLWAVPLYKGQARAKLNSYDRDGKKQEVIEQVILIGLDDSSMVGAPPQVESSPAVARRSAGPMPSSSTRTGSPSSSPTSPRRSTRTTIGSSARNSR